MCEIGMKMVPQMTFGYENRTPCYIRRQAWQLVSWTRMIIYCHMCFSFHYKEIN